MAEPDATGPRVLLAGPAEPALVQATRDAFAEAGYRVAVAADRGDTGTLGGLDVCVCFARAAARAPLMGTEDQAWERDLDRHLLGPRRLAMAAAREMAAARDVSTAPPMGSAPGGSIVLVGSADAFHAYPDRSVASVAMGGLLGLTRSMAVELARLGIRTNLVVAGPMGSHEGGPPGGAEGALAERTLLRSPVHRFARPAEVAAAIRFVAGPDAAFMTGQTLRVDGGWSSLNQAPEGMRFA